jgi:glycosyltransferase involved in cell wall biosynthesis
MMEPTARVSVCMAAYNGAEYISQQLASILEQLSPQDEVIVVDDCSKDGTADIVESLGDGRIRLLRNTTNLGYVRTFERALNSANGKYLLLSDQDDLWTPGRVDAMLAALKDHAVVASNFTVFGGEPNWFQGLRLKSADSTRYLSNLFLLWVGVRPYYGCTMGVNRDALRIILPFPAFLHETHDQWIAMCGNVMRSMVHLEQFTVARRLHETNTTPKAMRSAGRILSARWMLLRAFVVALQRVRRPARARVKSTA